VSDAALDPFATFGELLKYLRRRARLTQRELGLAVGYSEAQVNRLESGQRLPDLVAVKTHFVDALGLQREPELAARLTALASTAHSKGSAGQPPLPPATGGQIHPPWNNLPTPLTDLVGREHDVTNALKLLRRSGVRLVTLLGPPGVGKTRLAIEAARLAGEDFADGVCFVALAPLADSGLVAATLAQALGVGTAQADPLSGVKLHLRDKQTLLVLDNFEHLLDAAPLVAEVLAAAPGVQVLTTSRVALRLSAEHVFEVPLLDEPAAVELFVMRGAAVRPSLSLAPENRTVIAEICRRLDRLPLALELAAARLRLFGPKALLARLEAEGVPFYPALDTLAEGPRDLPARQRTLRNTVAWSYALLTPDQQHLLRHLSAFAGACGLEAARAVAGDPPAFDADLQALLDSSLVQHREGPDGEPRLSLLEMIREFAAEQLVACGEVEGAHHRHAAFYTGLVTQASGMIRTREWPDAFEYSEYVLTWVNRCALEYDNLRAVLTWSLGGAHATGSGTELAIWLFHLWWYRGPWDEAVHWLEQALAYTEPDARSRTRARLLISLARFVGAVRDSARAVEAAKEALAIYKSLEVEREIVFALWILTDVEVERNNLAEAQAVGEEWLSFAGETGDYISSALFYLGDIALCRQDFPRAVALLEESLRLEPRHAAAQNVRGTLACYLGDYDRATALCEGSLALMRAGQWTHGIATVLHSLGDIALFRGDVGQARARFGESLRLFSENGNKQRSVWCLGGLAALEATAGDAVRAVTLWAAAEAVHAAIGSPRPALRVEDYRQRVEAARAKIDGRTWFAAAAAGRAMSFEQAVTYALEGVPSST
jgi:predicted ATPase